MTHKINHRLLCAALCITLCTANGCSTNEKTADKPPKQKTELNAAQHTPEPDTPTQENPSEPLVEGEAPPPDEGVGESPTNTTQELPPPPDSSSGLFSGEGGISAELPDFSKAKEAELGKSITIKENKEKLYKFTLKKAELTDARNDEANEELNKQPQLMFTYTYENLADKTMLLDDMNFYCIAESNGTLELCTPYYLTSAKPADLAEKGKSCTAEIVFTLPEKLDSVTLLLADLAHPEADMLKFTLPADELK